MRVIAEQGPGAGIPRVPVSCLVGHGDGGPVPLVRFTADGKYCLTAGSDRTIRLWNPCRLDPKFPPSTVPYVEGLDIPISHLPQALPIQVYDQGIRHVPTALEVDSTSKNLVVASDRTVVWLDSVTGKLIRQWHGHTAVINSVAVASAREADVSVVASGSYDATVCLWDGRSSSQRPIQTLKDAKDSVTTVRMLYMEATVHTASVDGILRTYDLRKGRLFSDDCHSPITGFAIAKNPRNQTLARLTALSCLDGVIRVRDLGGDFEHGKRSVSVICRGRHVAGRYSLECAFSADSSFVVSGSEDGRAVLYDTSCSSTVLGELVGHTAPTCSVATHPIRSDVVITASYDGDCVVWANRRDFMQWEG